MFRLIRKNINIREYIRGIRILEKCNDDFLHLTANENVVSKTARQFMSSTLSERYYFGGGVNGVVRIKALDAVGMKELEDLIEVASKVANSKLGSSLISFNLLSGIHAMISTLLAVSEPGDTIMTLNNRFGGHFMTNSVFNRIGRKQILTEHDQDSGVINIEKTVELFKKMNAKILYLDMMLIIEKLPLEQLREALGKEALIIYDASHTLGLIIGGEFQDPIREGADIIVGNTHKTFPGPQKAIIAFKDKGAGERIITIMGKGLYSSVHTNSMIVLAITMLEMDRFGKEYALQIISNANALGAELEKMGYMVKKTSRNEFSQNHQLHILIDNIPNAKEIPFKLYKNNITFNIFNSPSGKLYLRFGTQEATRRGMKEGDMKTIATLVDSCIKGKNVKKEVLQFTSKFNDIHYSFDNILR